MDKRVWKVSYSATMGETTLVFFPDWWKAHFAKDTDAALFT